MLDTYSFGQELKKLGYDFYSGVPCSFLNPLINYAINECDYVMSVNEGDAVAICAGAYLAGKKSVALMQNSGLTNAISPLTSLNYSFKLPVLGFVSLRGEPGLNDEPQHELMGTITAEMLELIKVKWDFLSDDYETMLKQLEKANEYIENNQSFFFIVKKGVLSKVDLLETEKKVSKNELKLNEKNKIKDFKRLDVLKSLSKLKDDDTVLLATTGKTGRELYEIEDASNNLYMVGSMGSISSIGLGIVLNSTKKVIAIDGDGALLMRMGNLATNAYYASDNFLHILIDNSMHDSTGGQFTAAPNVNFVDIAASTGYKQSLFAHSLEELESILAKWHKNPIMTFIHVKVQKGTKENLGRPKIKPYEVKDRLMKFIQE